MGKTRKMGWFMDVYGCLWMFRMFMEYRCGNYRCGGHWQRTRERWMDPGCICAQSRVAHLPINGLGVGDLLFTGT